MIRIPRVSLLFAVSALLAMGANSVSAAESKSAATRVVDFRYAMPWWQTAICLPDDPDKTLVGKEGQLLFDYGAAGGYRDFALCLQPDLAGGTKWVKQQTLSARTPFMRTEKDASGVKVT